MTKKQKIIQLSYIFLISILVGAIVLFLLLSLKYPFYINLYAIIIALCSFLLSFLLLIRPLIPSLQDEKFKLPNFLIILLFLFFLFTLFHTLTIGKIKSEISDLKYEINDLESEISDLSRKGSLRREFWLKLMR